MNLLFNNLTKKIISVVLATILWLFVNSNIAVVEQKTLDIHYNDIPNDLILIEAPQKMSYSIKTNPYYPSDIKTTITLSVSLDNTNPGWHVLPIQTSFDTPLPSYSRLILSSNTVRVFLDKKSFKNLAIKPDIEIASKNQEDYGIKNIKVTPEVTMVNGPQSIIGNLKNIQTNTITIYKPGHYKINKKIALPSSSVTVQDSEVSVEFTVDKDVVTKTIIIPITINNLKRNLGIKKMSHREIQVTFSGLTSQLKDIESNNEGILSIDLSSINSKGRYFKIPIIKNLPAGVTIVAPKSLSSIDISVDATPKVDEKPATKTPVAPTPIAEEPVTTQEDTTKTENSQDVPVEKEPTDTTVNKAADTVAPKSPETKTNDITTNDTKSEDSTTKKPVKKAPVKQEPKTAPPQ